MIRHHLSMVTSVTQMGTGNDTCAGAGSGASSCQWSSTLPPIQIGAGTGAGTGTATGHPHYLPLNWILDVCTGAGTGAGSVAGTGTSSCQWLSALPPTQIGAGTGHWYCNWLSALPLAQMGTGDGSAAGPGTSSCQWSSTLPPTQIHSNGRTAISCYPLAQSSSLKRVGIYAVTHPLCILCTLCTVKK